MLLILLAPLVSRWLAHGTEQPPEPPVLAVPHSTPAMHMPGDPAHHHAMAADAGAHDPHDVSTTTRTDTHAGHDMGVECDYCLIAARMISLLVALLMALIGWRPPRFAVVWTRRWVGRVAAGHLGARGPPRLA
ncbi:DUF2946 family protein [Stenotrophomonas sp. NPDC077659]|uniref:DUF2946 family protein n=1 Tax=Stenotrophomonas sp. NPDC077659 TaxID=3390694 RepID=UPI003CFCCAD0